MTIKELQNTHGQLLSLHGVVLQWDENNGNRRLKKASMTIDQARGWNLMEEQQLLAWCTTTELIGPFKCWKKPQHQSLNHPDDYYVASLVAQGCLCIE